MGALFFVASAAVHSAVLRNVFTHPRRLPLIAPSILSADFARMGDECRGVLDAGGDLLHLDVMDGHFVPNLTMGPDLCRSLRMHLGPTAFLDVHLMVTDPAAHVPRFLEAGADHITFHIEVFGPGEERAIEELVGCIHEHRATAGIAINPPTPVSAILPFVELVDLVLVMSVNPGFSGQPFIGEVLSKTEVIADLLLPNQRLEMDGGIGPSNAGSVRDAGCDVLVAASAIFGCPARERANAIQAIRGI